DLTGYQIGREHWQLIVLPMGPAVFDIYVLAFGKAGLPQALAERAQAILQCVRRSGVQESDDWLPRLLRPRRQPPCDGRASEAQDEFAASHGHPSSRAARPYHIIVGETSLCSTAKSIIDWPLWVSRVGSVRARRSRHVRYASDSDQIGAWSESVMAFKCKS